MISRAGFRNAAPEQPENPESARRYALGLLARRDFGSAELINKLTVKGYTAEAATEAVAALQEERLLDDARSLEAFVRAHAARGQGPMRIRQELATRAKPPGSWAEKGKQMRFLQYRGFSSDHIRLALGQDPEDP